MLFGNIWIIVIIIIILIVVSGFYYYRKKNAKKELIKAEEITNKSTVVSTSDKTIKKDLAAITPKQPSVITEEVGDGQQLKTTIAPTPMLAKPTQIHQTSLKQQRPQIIDHQAQLPPAESQPRPTSAFLPSSPQQSPSSVEKPIVRKQDE